eukprot:395250-Hanusia_phi.AAC.2
MEALYTRTISGLHCKARAQAEGKRERQLAAEKALKMKGVWRGQRESAMLAAAKKGEADVIAMLVIGGSEVNGRSADGSSALGHIYWLKALEGER